MPIRLVLAVEHVDVVLDDNGLLLKETLSKSKKHTFLVPVAIDAMQTTAIINESSWKKRHGREW